MRRCPAHSLPDHGSERVWLEWDQSHIPRHETKHNFCKTVGRINTLYVITVVVLSAILQYPTCIISYREICYIVSRLGTQFAVLYRPNSWQLPNRPPNIYSMCLCFHPSNHNHNTKENLLSFSYSFSICPFQPITTFLPLQVHNETGSQPDTSMNPEHVFSWQEIFKHTVTKEFAYTHSHTNTCLKCYLSYHNHKRDR
jgi:hypothetical protein